MQPAGRRERGRWRGCRLVDDRREGAARQAEGAAAGFACTDGGRGRENPRGGVGQRRRRHSRGCDDPSRDSGAPEVGHRCGRVQPFFSSSNCCARSIPGLCDVPDIGSACLHVCLPARPRPRSRFLRLSASLVQPGNPIVIGSGNIVEERAYITSACVRWIGHPDTCALRWLPLHLATAP